MKKENDKWIDILKEKINSHAEPIADKSWERIENQIRLNKRKQYIKLLSAAACIIILLGLGIYLMNNDKQQIDKIIEENNSTKIIAEENENYNIADEINSSDNNNDGKANYNTSGDINNINNNINNSSNNINSNNNKENNNNSSNSNNNSNNSSNSTINKNNNNYNSNNSSSNDNNSVNNNSSSSNNNNSSNSTINKNNNINNSIDNSTKNNNTKNNNINNSNTGNTRDNSNYNKNNKNSNNYYKIYNNSTNRTFKKAKGKLAIAVYSKTGGKIDFNSLSKEYDSSFGFVQSESNTLYTPSRFELLNYPPLYLENNQLSEPKPKEPKPEHLYNYNYKFPISFGISLQKAINAGLSIESGVFITKLVTRIDNDNSSEQKLWYIGIPAKISYKVLKKNNYNIYISGGGAIELCMYAQYSGNFPITKAKDMPLQFSLNASTGAEFNISPLISLYLEPGVSRYIKNENAPETIRKKNPTLLNINAGLRFSL